MPSATKKIPSSTLPATRKKVSSTKKPAKKIVDSGSDPLGESHINKLKAELRLFTHPDFSYGDYWPKLDRRLYGLLPDLIGRVLAVLDVRHPHKSVAPCHHCRCHDRGE